MKPNNTKRGVVSLVLVLSVGIISFGMAVALTNTVVAGLNKNRNLTSTSQSFYTAEAAVREGTYQYVKEMMYTGADFTTLNEVSLSTIAVTSFGTHAEIRGIAENTTHREVV